ncbi:siderophore-interacting protein [Actinoplanes sp. CA-131856]
MIPARIRSVSALTPHMREIELAVPALSRRRCNPGAHVVVHVPDRRVYSIWRHDPASATVVLRVALHDSGGPGCVWASEASPGDRVTLEPPRTKISIDQTARYHLFAGDETGAVPLLAMRATLGSTVPVHGVFETTEAAEEIPGSPALPWVHRGRASAVASRVLLRALQDLELPSSPGAAYIAGESDTCRLLQRHLIEQRGWPRRAVHTQPQWSQGRPGFGAGSPAAHRTAMT